MVGENQRQVPWNNKNTESIGGWQNYDGLLMDEGCLRIYVSFTAIAETKPSERTLQSFAPVNPVPGLFLSKPADRGLMRSAKRVGHVLCFEHCE